MEFTRKGFTAMILYDFKSSLSPQDCAARLQNAFGREAPHLSTVRRWQLIEENRLIAYEEIRGHSGIVMSACDVSRCHRPPPAHAPPPPHRRATPREGHIRHEECISNSLLKIGPFRTRPLSTRRNSRRRYLSVRTRRYAFYACHARYIQLIGPKLFSGRRVRRPDASAHSKLPSSSAIFFRSPADPKTEPSLLQQRLTITRRRSNFFLSERREAEKERNCCGWESLMKKCNAR
ncbi:hypothetical protein EVAR_8310_1 [Eumeta japonica]|uniref:Mos1 transposase HTH domain-containing protein n=1 Tax=Eumeta variegata TaxID=151549 RepID=A0A4C1VE16_EUMVA|nr:hypothetical protein EVAR_8310_1 [Eumeta japonica]